MIPRQKKDILAGNRKAYRLRRSPRSSQYCGNVGGARNPKSSYFVKTTRKMYDEQDFGRVRMVGLLSPRLAHDLQILKWISTRSRLCRCGKILSMSAKERESYDAVVREIEERRLRAEKKLAGDDAVEIRG